MSIAERYREYARVLDMCEGTSVYPWSCVKYMGKPWIMENRLDLDRQGHYDFAVAILEGKPVFIGDVLYHKLTEIGFDVTGDVTVDSAKHSWNKPKRTFVLYGELLPMPVNNEQTSSRVHVGGELYYFNSHEERNNFELSLNKIIKGAIENARLQNK